MVCPQRPISAVILQLLNILAFQTVLLSEDQLLKYVKLYGIFLFHIVIKDLKISTQNSDAHC